MAFKKWRFVLLLLLLPGALLYANQPVHTYVVYFSDKPDTLFDPYTYFDTKAIERRLHANLPLYDERDLPVYQDYIRILCTHKIELLVVSRWLNAVFINADEATAASIARLPFVRYTDLYVTCDKKVIAEDVHSLDTNETLLLQYQTNRFNAEAWKKQGMTGKGIRIAVFDVGFSGAHKHDAFQHLRFNNQIKATYDFIGKKEDVYHGGAHGTNTLSCIAGISNGINMGMAPDAEFLLARTEWNLKEKKAEEYRWLEASEWADKNGADIISSSLGYGKNWYQVRDMNGKNSVVSFAAAVAAQKGILVVNSAGNEYQSEWKMIVKPSDGDSVLSVGGTDPYTDRHIDFSSIGPTFDRRMKPNVSAPARVIAAFPDGLTRETSGTSFSCPLVSGFAACAWQANRKLTNMELFSAIEKSGNLYPYFDYMHGYGVPQAHYFLRGRADSSMAEVEITHTDSVSSSSDVLSSEYLIRFTREEMRKRIEEFAAAYDTNNNEVGLNLYWNIQSKHGILKNYHVISVHSTQAIQIIIPYEEMEEGDRLNIHFEGYTYTTAIK